jgi:hypothetical protein
LSSLNSDTAVGILGPAWASPGRVRQIAVPAAALELSTLPRIDYADAFVVEVGARPDQTPEQWARATLENAPLIMRGALPCGWLSLGLCVGGFRSGRFVFGWEVRRSTPEFALLGAVSRTGMPAELLFRRERHCLLFATFVQHRNPVVRAVWGGVAPAHRAIVRYLLEHAGGS